jgi:type I restriction enzyme S subunit
VEDAWSDWRIDLFSNAVEVSPTRSLVAGEEYPYVPMDALSTDSPKVAYVENRAWSRSSGTRFQNGDVLFARITPSAENGKTALVDFLEEGGKGFGSTEFIVLSPRRGGIEDSRLLYYLVKFEKIRNQAIQRMTGSTGRQRIPPEAFDGILCPIPPVNEQQKIAAILSRVDDAIQKTDEIIAKTQQLKKGLMQQLLTKGIGHTKFKQTDLGEIPEQWQITTIGSTTQVKNGSTPRRNVREYWENGTIPWIPTAQVNDRYIEKAQEFITERGLHETSLSWIPKGSILLAMIGQGATRGKVARLLVDATINQNFAAIFPSPSMNMDFLFHYLDFNYWRIRNLGRGGNQWALNCEVVKKICIPLPDKDEQTRIASILSCVDEKIRNDTRRKAQLDRLKRGLMRVLLTGKVRVKVG